MPSKYKFCPNCGAVGLSEEYHKEVRFNWRLIRSNGQFGDPRKPIPMKTGPDETTTEYMISCDYCKEHSIVKQEKFD